MDRGMCLNEYGVPERRRITRSLTRNLTRSSVAVENGPAKRMVKFPSSKRGSRRGRPKKNEANLVYNFDIKEEEVAPEEAEDGLPTESNIEPSKTNDGNYMDHLDIKEEEDDPEEAENGPSTESNTESSRRNDGNYMNHLDIEAEEEQLMSEADKAQETKERPPTVIKMEPLEDGRVFFQSDPFTNYESTDGTLFMVLTNYNDWSTFGIDYVMDYNIDSIITGCDISPIVVEEATTDKSTGNGSWQPKANEENDVGHVDVKEEDKSEGNDKLQVEDTNRKEEEATENQGITRRSSRSLKKSSAAASPLPAKRGKKTSSLGRGSRRGRPKKTEGNYLNPLEEEAPKTKEASQENEKPGDTENSLSNETNMKTTEVVEAATSLQSDNCTNYVSADQGTSHKEIGATEKQRLTRSIPSLTSTRVQPLPSKRGKMTSSSVRGSSRGRPRKITGNDASCFEIKVEEEELKCKEVSEEDKPIEAGTMQNNIDSIHSQTSEINTEPSIVEEGTIAQATSSTRVPPLPSKRGKINSSSVRDPVAAEDYRTCGDRKPPFTYATLICMAMSANNNKMTLSAIYSWIRDNFMYYRNAGPTWQNSITHTLSLNKCFVKIPRTKDEAGIGGFWRLDMERLEEEQRNKRRLGSRRGRPKKIRVNDVSCFEIKVEEEELKGKEVSEEDKLIEAGTIQNNIDSIHSQTSEINTEPSIVEEGTIAQATCSTRVPPLPSKRGKITSSSVRDPVAAEDYRTCGDRKPPFTYATLICMAMRANNNKMTLSAIYSWIRDNFIYYRNASPTWQNSITQTLSLNKCFVKIPRSKDEPGRGGFWRLDMERLEEEQRNKRRLGSRRGCPKKIRVNDVSCFEIKVEEEEPKGKEVSEEDKLIEAGTVQNNIDSIHSQTSEINTEPSIVEEGTIAQATCSTRVPPLPSKRGKITSSSVRDPVAAEDYKTCGDRKPPFTYATLICMAMRANNNKMTLSSIYSWIRDNFMYYRNAVLTWQNSIKQNLSLNKCFVKIPRSKDEPGRGGFWRLDMERLEEEQRNKRCLGSRRGRPKKIRVNDVSCFEIKVEEEELKGKEVSEEDKPIEAGTIQNNIDSIHSQTSEINTEPSIVEEGTIAQATSSTRVPPLPSKRGKITSSSVRDPVAAEDYRTCGDRKPPFTYATLISMAMRANNNKMTLSAIYSWIRDNFMYYRNAGPTWQNSITQTLSLNKCFVKIPRSKDEPGRGGFWRLDMKRLEEEQQNKRRLGSRRGRPKKIRVNDVSCFEIKVEEEELKGKEVSEEDKPIEAGTIQNNIDSIHSQTSEINTEPSIVEEGTIAQATCSIRVPPLPSKGGKITSSSIRDPVAAEDYRTCGDRKPPFTYATLICMAMRANNNKMTLSSIYSWIRDNFMYYRNASPTWQNSIKQNLSLNKCFVKIPRSKDEPGRGGFWRLDMERLEEEQRNKRRLGSRRGRPRKIRVNDVSCFEIKEEEEELKCEEVSEEDKPVEAETIQNNIDSIHSQTSEINTEPSIVQEATIAQATSSARVPPLPSKRGKITSSSVRDPVAAEDYRTCGDRKPPFTYATLICMAMRANNNKMTLSSIYSWIRDNFMYYRNADPTWQNSIKHNLTVNKCFVNIPRRSIDKPGKGGFWRLDMERLEEEQRNNRRLGPRRGRPRKFIGNDVSYIENKVEEEELKRKEVSEEDKPIEAETIQYDIDSIHSQTSEINTEPSIVEDATIAQATVGLPLQIDTSMDNGSTEQENNLPGQQRNQISEVHYSHGFIKEPVHDGNFTSSVQLEINWRELLDFQNALNSDACFDAGLVHTSHTGSSTEPMFQNVLNSDACFDAGLVHTSHTGSSTEPMFQNALNSDACFDAGLVHTSHTGSSTEPMVGEEFQNALNSDACFDAGLVHTSHTGSSTEPMFQNALNSDACFDAGLVHTSHTGSSTEPMVGEEFQNALNSDACFDAGLVHTSHTGSSTEPMETVPGQPGSQLNVGPLSHAYNEEPIIDSDVSRSEEDQNFNWLEQLDKTVPGQPGSQLNLGPLSHAYNEEPIIDSDVSRSEEDQNFNWLEQLDKTVPGQPGSQLNLGPLSHAYNEEPDIDSDISRSEEDQNFNWLEQLDETVPGQPGSQLNLGPLSHAYNEEPIIDSDVSRSEEDQNFNWLEQLDKTVPGQPGSQLNVGPISHAYNEEPIIDSDVSRSEEDQNFNWLEQLDKTVPGQPGRQLNLGPLSHAYNEEPDIDSDVSRSEEDQNINWLEQLDKTVPGQPGSQLNLGPLSHAYNEEPIIDSDVSRSEEDQNFNWLEQLDNTLLEESNARLTSEIDNIVDFNQLEPICEGLDDNIKAKTFATPRVVNNENTSSFNPHEEFCGYFNTDSYIKIPTENIGTLDNEFVAKRKKCFHDQRNICMASYQVLQTEVSRLLLKLTETCHKQEAQTKILDSKNKPKNNDFFYKFNPPYFKDRHRIPASLNNETKRRNKLVIKPLSQYIREGCVEFTRYENVKLRELIVKQLVENVTLRLERKKKDVMRTSRSVKTSSKVKQQIAAIDKEIDETKNKTLTELLGDKDDWTFDWDRISITGFDQKHSSHTCNVYWQNYLKPSVNKGPWSEEEEDRLVEIVKRYKHENWVKITEELGTNRSAVIVFKHYQQKFFTKSEFYKEQAREWSEEEERDVEKWVEYYQSNRELICWRTISQILGRTAIDVQSHWVQLTQQEIVKGKYTEKEDKMILEAVQQQGLDSIVLRHKFKCRTIQQISYRYKRLTENTKQGHFKPEEDKLLIELINQYGVGNWSSIGKAMVTRNRTQVRQRYNVLKNLDKYKGQIKK